MYVPAAFHRLPPLHARPLVLPANARPATTTATAETAAITAAAPAEAARTAPRSTPLRARWQTVGTPDGRSVLVASWHVDR